jgi:hypothetical protein
MSINRKEAEPLSVIARELEQEIRDKKRTASGIHSRKGKRGYVGKMLFPSDIMSRKDKYNHRKAGKCIVTNLRDEIISRDKFKLMPKEEQVKTLLHWRDKYSTADIIKGLGISKGSYYQLASYLGVTKQYKQTKSRKGNPKNNSVAITANPIPEPIQVISKKAVVDGLLLAYSGQFTADEIVRKIDKIGLLLSDEPNKFEVEIKIRELA